jgi:hypothetical protein
MTEKEIIKKEVERLLSDSIGMSKNEALEHLKSFIGDMSKEINKKQEKYIIITQKILDYINNHKPFFENPLPTIGDKWALERKVTYPLVNYGKPVVEVENNKGEWMRLPASIVKIRTEKKLSKS